MISILWIGRPLDAEAWPFRLSLELSLLDRQSLLCEKQTFEVLCLSCVLCWLETARLSSHCTCNVTAVEMQVLDRLGTLHLVRHTLTQQMSKPDTAFNLGPAQSSISTHLKVYLPSPPPPYLPTHPPPLPGDGWHQLAQLQGLYLP